MYLDDFAAGIERIVLRSLPAPGRPLRWALIVNPKAGGFTIRSRWKRHYAILKAYGEKAQGNPRREAACPAGVAGNAPGGMLLTQSPDHANRIVRALLEEVKRTLAYTQGRPQDMPFYLILCAGGDGTGLEALIALCQAEPEVRDHTAILRLPLGTGNDGADSWELDGALDLLILPSRIEKARSLRLSTAQPGKGPFLAFNILSVGLDAFVTHMTNKMKGKLPGDSYKLWVDIAALLYDRIYRVGFLDIKALDGSAAEPRSLRERVLLMAVGASGRRTYGSHKRILPDDRNVCLVRQMPLFRKIALKDLFTTGGHVDKPESLLFNAHRLEFQGEYPILAQMDGETVLLRPEDFPAVIEVSDPIIPTLKPQTPGGRP